VHTPPITPDMLAILMGAADANGEVSITRPRQAGWPDGLHHIRMLEKGEYLRRVAMVDRPAEGSITAVYVLTSKGQRAAADARDVAPAS
jgi:hypothetical protein